MSPVQGGHGKINDLVAISREQDPDTWAKVDGVARIIDPSAFAAVPEMMSQLMHTSLAYAKAKAQAQAWDILVFLEIIPPLFDWEPVLEEYARRQQIK
jgi:hypothetical protein